MLNKEQSTTQSNAILEEYKSLREEIMRRQDARLLILGFTVAAIGTIVGLALRDAPQTVQGLNYNALALISFALALIIAALLLTIQHTQLINCISGYIREFIEPELGGLGWETRWNRLRQLARANPKRITTPLVASKPLAAYYCFLTIVTYAMAFVVGLQYYRLALALVSCLAIGACICAYDLYKQKTKGWRVNWDVIKSSTTRPPASA